MVTEKKASIMTEKRGHRVHFSNYNDERGVKPHHPPKSRPNRLSRRYLVLIALVVLGYKAWTTFPFQLSTAVPPPPSYSASAHLGQPLEGYEAIEDEEGIKSYDIGQRNSVRVDYREVVTILQGEKVPYEMIQGAAIRGNAIGRMPLGSRYDALIIAARSEGDEDSDVITGKQEIVGFFANYDIITRRWERTGPEPHVLNLPTQHHESCGRNRPDSIIPSFMWSDQAEPLAFITSSTLIPGKCRAMGVIDLRVIWPDLNEHLQEIGHTAPLQHDPLTAIVKTASSSEEDSNWAPFFAGYEPVTGSSAWPYFQTSLISKSVVRVDSKISTNSKGVTSVLSQEVELVGPITEQKIDSTCLKLALPSTWDMTRLQQVTPFLRVTTCPRGACSPDTENTVLMGMAQYRKKDGQFSRVFVTIKPEEPFDFLSVSQPLNFGIKGVEKNEITTISMAFFPKDLMEDVELSASEREADQWLSHGWLDDVVVISTGSTRGSHNSIHVNMDTAMRGHTLCDWFKEIEEPRGQVSV